MIDNPVKLTQYETKYKIELDKYIDNIFSELQNITGIPEKWFNENTSRDIKTL